MRGGSHEDVSGQRGEPSGAGVALAGVVPARTVPPAPRVPALAPVLRTRPAALPVQSARGPVVHTCVCVCVFGSQPALGGGGLCLMMTAERPRPWAVVQNPGEGPLPLSASLRPAQRGDAFCTISPG